MKGRSASPRMYFRIGSIAIPYLINLLLQHNEPLHWAFTQSVACAPGTYLAYGRRRARRPSARARSADLGPGERRADRADLGREDPAVHQALYYALGITLANGWEFQNPFIDGYTGVLAYLKAQDISVGIVTTQLPQSSNNGVGNATILLAKLTEYLSPAHKIVIPPPA